MRHVYNLTEGMAVKAILGTMFTSATRTPLYEVNNFYRDSPKKMLFGPFVGDRGLSDTILATRMDSIYEMNRKWKDFNEIIWETQTLVCRIFGLASEDYYLDTTDIDLTGTKYTSRGDGAALPEHFGKPKSGKTALLHKSIMVAVRGCTVLCYAQAHDGAESDVIMDNEAIRRLIGKVDASRAIFTMDCKGCTLPNISLCVNGGVGFVTKVPERFYGGLRDDVVHSVVTGIMDESEKRPGRLYYDTVVRIASEDDGLDAELRLIAYKLPNGIRRAEKYLRSQGRRKLDRAMNALSHKRFESRDAAERAFAEALASADAPVYNVLREVFEDPVRKRRDEPCWRVKPHPATVIESEMSDACKRYSVNVLITNLPFSTMSCGDPRRGSTADDVIEYYLRQCVVERRFRMMKTCQGMGHVYIHTLRRQDTMIFMTALATMIQSAMDEKLKRTHIKGQPNITMERAADKLVNARLGYDKEKDRVYISGGGDSAKIFADMLERLGIEKRLLFGF